MVCCPQVKSGWEAHDIVVSSGWLADITCISSALQSRFRVLTLSRLYDRWRRHDLKLSHIRRRLLVGLTVVAVGELSADIDLTSLATSSVTTDKVWE
jgi:hypothetical protein